MNDYLVKTTKRTKRRLGQGHGSGRGKTAGRGTKGQKARGRIALTFEGGALPLIKRLPFHRGKDKNHALKGNPVIVNVKALNLLPKDSTVNVETLAKHKLIEKQEVEEYGIKILGDGDLSVPLTVTLPVSKGAASKIKKAGGTVALNS